jgi:type IV secretory pathway TraG/TraD family ATPase VirD4
MKQPDNQFEIIIGENVHHGVTTPLGLTRTDRERHMYVIGGTGNGKSTLLLYAIVQDILAGRGVGIIDPHGDLAEKILQYIPEERIKDVVYFNPDDIEYPTGLNLLEIDPSITGDERLKVISKTTEAIIEAFRSAFSDDGTGGSRIESVLRNGILTAMTVEGATLFTIQKLLRNPKFREEVTSKLKDEHLVDFWEEELGKAGDMQRVSMTKGVTTKLDRLQLDPIVGRIFGQEKSTINFGEILDGKIFICNLSKKIGPDNSSLLGTIILSLLQIAAQARADTAEEDRKPFYLYVDEFQNFATKTFTDMVAEARKYRLFLTMAEQTTSQQDKEIAETILGNVGVLVSFRTGNPADERMLTPFYGGFLEPGEINNLSPFNYYVRLAASAQEPTSGRTIVLPGVDDKSIAQRVKAASRESYARKYVEPPKPKKPAKKKAAPALITKPKRQRYTKQ